MEINHIFAPRIYNNTPCNIQELIDFDFVSVNSSSVKTTRIGLVTMEKVSPRSL